ncbi:MAG: MerR family transcriptional regulator [Parachlamydiaceae bacterium]|nr:MerR family transcriptional regulator [Parachlamydiaceae bacterium]
MAYTVTKLAKISGVSVRTLHWYDEVGLLKPAYHGPNGYRYYEEEQLLILQQILFFRELGFELKQIQKILKRNDFDKIVALSSHRQILQKNLARTRELIKTIDETIEHLKGTKKMKEQEIYYGFSKEKQADYEKELIKRFGDKVKDSIAESHQNVKNWSKADWDKSSKEFDEICKELVKMIEKHSKTNSKEVQSIVRRHYLWLKKFWTPTNESYSGHGQFIAKSDLRKAYEAHHPQLPEFIAEAIQAFSEIELA